MGQGGVCVCSQGSEGQPAGLAASPLPAECIQRRHRAACQSMPYTKQPHRQHQRRHQRQRFRTWAWASLRCTGRPGTAGTAGTAGMWLGLKVWHTSHAGRHGPPYPSIAAHGVPCVTGRPAAGTGRLGRGTRQGGGTGVLTYGSWQYCSQERTGQAGSNSWVRYCSEAGRWAGWGVSATG